MASAQSFIQPAILWQTVGLQASQTAVHLGCGPGFYLIAAAKIVGKDGKVIGVDIRPDMLTETESRAAREGVASIVQTVRADAEHPDGATLPKEVADFVLLVNILNQSHPEKIFSTARHLLKDGGRVVVVGWNTAATPFGPPPSKRINEETMKEFITGAQLRVTKSFSPSPYHYGFVTESL